MKVWVVTPHDSVEGELWGQRHAVSLTKALAAAGFEVTYWASTYSHVAKVRRSSDWSISEQHGVRTVFVPAGEYSKNVSIRRLLSFKMYASNLLRRCTQEPSPDAIIASLPTPFVDGAVVKLAKFHSAALIAEYRDLWPELFVSPFPPAVRPVIRVLMAPLYRSRNLAFGHAAAVMATCKDYLERAYGIAPHLRSTASRVLYHSGLQFAEFRNLMESNTFDAELPQKTAEEIWVTYAGTLGNNYDLPTLWTAAELIAKQDRNIRVLVAGDGPLRERLVERIRKRELRNIYYLGALSLPKLARLYRRSDIGLSIYAPGSTVVIPAKAYDLYAAALPIVNSAQGEFMEFIRTENLGVGYRPGSPKSLAESILNLAHNPEKRAQCRQNLSRIAPDFDRDRQYAQVSEVVRWAVSCRS